MFLSSYSALQLRLNLNLVEAGRKVGLFFRYSNLLWQLRTSIFLERSLEASDFVSVARGSDSDANRLPSGSNMALIFSYVWFFVGLFFPLNTRFGLGFVTSILVVFRIDCGSFCAILSELCCL